MKVHTTEDDKGWVTGKTFSMEEGREGTSPGGRKFGLLLWKNWLLQKRRFNRTLVELVVPVFFCIVLVVIRDLAPSDRFNEPTLYNTFSLEAFPETLRPPAAPGITDALYKAFFGQISLTRRRRSADVSTRTLSRTKRQFFSSAVYWPIAYTPENEATRRVMDILKDRMEQAVEPVGFESESMLVQNLSTLIIPTKETQRNSAEYNGDDFLGGIVFINPFTEEDKFPKSIQYKIRLKGALRNGAKRSVFSPPLQWYTEMIYPPFQVPGPREKKKPFGPSPGYYDEGFLTLQHNLDMSIAEYISGTIPSVPVNMGRMPYPPYIDDKYLVALQAWLPLILLLSYLLPALTIVKNVVYEKEKKLKESMKMMGLPNYLHWAAWFVKSLLFLLLTTILITILLCTRWRTLAVLDNSDPSLVFCFLLCYIIGIISFCFFTSTLFSKANTASAAIGIFWIFSYLPNEFLRPRYGSLTLFNKLTLCMYMNTGMGLGAQLSGMYEGTGSGLQWHLLFTGVSPDDSFSIGHVMMMMLIDSVIYGILAWYIEAVRPGEFGVPLPYYFPFTKDYWIGAIQNSKDMFTRNQNAFVGADPEYFEPDQPGQQIGIKIEGLTKVFPKVSKGKDKIAVDKMFLNMYCNQITVLLGHNGAGKTTTMSMLTGLFPPTSGSALVNGYDIVKEMKQVRRSIGMCPQHDVLFDELTVAEHLEFFCKLKGMPGGKVEEEVKKIISQLGLEDKTNAQSKTLSGGMKRKLSVGIALCADSQVVILDEPTSGMDPGARRLIWDLLQKERLGRTILLTTHFMEEADLLGDRIAIMALGVVQCCGSSMFLKKRYGAGYYLIIVKQEECDVQAITDVIQSYIAEAKVDQNHGAELSYILPNEDIIKFEELFNYLEENKEKLKISSYGASQTTMDEVFLRVGEAAEHQHQMAEYNSYPHQPVAVATAPEETVQTVQVEALSSAESLPNGLANGSLPGSVGDSFVKSHRRTNSGTAHGIRAQLKREIEEQAARDIASKRERTNLLNGGEAAEEVLEGTSNNHPPGTVLHSILAAAASVTNLATSAMSDQGERRTPVRRNTGCVLLLQHFWAMLVKKMLYIMRNAVITGVQALVPVGFLILALVIVRNIPGVVDKPPPYWGTYSSYRSTQTPIQKADSSNDTEAIVKSLGGVLVGSNDPLFLKEGTNLSDFLLSQSSQDLPWYNLHVMSGIEVAASGVTVLFNCKPFHSPIAALSVVDEAIVRAHTGDEELTINTANHPLPRTDTDKLTQDSRQNLGFQIGFNLAFGTSFLSASLVMFLIKERCSKAKHLQFVSGVNFVTYWLATAIVDFCLYLIPFSLSMLCLWLFNEENLREPEQLGIIFLIMCCFAFAMTPLMYLCSFLFTVPSSGFIRMSFINCFIGMATLITVTILRIPDLKLVHIADILDWIFLVFPPYALAAAITDLYSNHRFTKICDQAGMKLACDFGVFDIPCCKATGNCGPFGCIDWQLNVFAWEKLGIGRMLAFLIMEGVLFYLVIAMIELKVFQSIHYFLQKIRYKLMRCVRRTTSLEMSEREADLEDDVKRESQKVQNSSMEKLLGDNILVFKDLTKRYSSNNHLAVNRLNLMVPKGECFGLLGINGAGKTTTFKMLTGDHTVSSGDAYVNGHSITDNIKKVQQAVGYCPQFDAILDQMTGRETLRMFARLRGVPEGRIDDHITTLAQQLIVTPHLDNLVGNYSGGNKRKISTGIALIGDPPLVLLDEPTSGMDPVARRHLWDVLTAARDGGTSIVLTSHSMEECEALCTRLAIMVNGLFRCLGSPQHLKNKFSEGYSLIIKVTMEGNRDADLLEVESLPPQMALTHQFITNEFPVCIVRELQWGRLEYFIAAEGVTWAHVFGTMERNKLKLSITDYSVTQTTLERVFLNFTRQQAAEEGSEDSASGWGSTLLSSGRALLGLIGLST